MFKWSCFEIYKIYVNTLKISVTNLFYSFHIKESKNNILCSFIKKDLKLMAIKKNCFRPLKQCLSDHVMKFIKFNSNTLKISVANLFHSFHVKKSKKKYIV